MDNSKIIYEGPSMLDGMPIVAIATGLTVASANAKTGAMIQTWIMRRDVAPVDAVASGADESVCGACLLRGAACYVKVFQAPRAVWNAYKRGRYGHAVNLSALTRGRLLRIGSYGDPAAVPATVWMTLTRHASGWTGYTHQWRRNDANTRALQPLLMASVETPTDRDRARALGWRTFRTTHPNAPLDHDREITCPASTEAGHKTTCDRCKLCQGRTSRARVDVTIRAHGAAPGINAYRRLFPIAQ